MAQPSRSKRRQERQSVMDELRRRGVPFSEHDDMPALRRRLASPARPVIIEVKPPLDRQMEGAYA